ncbi:MAG: hypothetical protein KGH94_03740 [Candidatus Micrarchaeota archaeon]|nr:hypothetical protein [Candidatus Micrarchaeota archaeon]
MLKAKHMRQSKQSPAERLHMDISKEIGLDLQESNIIKSVSDTACKAVSSFMSEIKSASLFEPGPGRKGSCYTGGTWMEARANASGILDSPAEVGRVSARSDNTIDYEIVDQVDRKLRDTLLGYDHKNGTNATGALKIIRQAVGDLAYRTGVAAIESKGMFDGIGNPKFATASTASSVEKYAIMAVSVRFVEAYGCAIENAEVLREPWKRLSEGEVVMGYSLDRRLISFRRREGKEKVNGSAHSTGL